VLLDVGNNDILDSGVGSIGGVAMGVWCKLVFLSGRGGVVPVALVGFAVVLVASSSALTPSSKASSSPVIRGSSSIVIAIHCRHCSSKRFASVGANRFRFGFRRREPLW
jgi:hypothetical protein